MTRCFATLALVAAIGAGVVATSAITASPAAACNTGACGKQP
ncbi:MAG: hypothetical protein ACOYOH_26640 [Paracraurococcus sp.]